MVVGTMENRSNVSSSGPDPDWVSDVRFAVEGVTQGIVGTIGLVGEILLLHEAVVAE